MRTVKIIISALRLILLVAVAHFAGRGLGDVIDREVVAILNALSCLRSKTRSEPKFDCRSYDGCKFRGVYRSARAFSESFDSTRGRSWREQAAPAVGMWVLQNALTAVCTSWPS